MSSYDVKCPQCGKLNKHLYLEETDGWMICEQCGKTYRAMNFNKCVKVPVFTGKQLVAIVGKH